MRLLYHPQGRWLDLKSKENFDFCFAPGEGFPPGFHYPAQFLGERRHSPDRLTTGLIRTSRCMNIDSGIAAYQTAYALQAVCSLP